jgi:hypothetical protein
MFGFAALLFWLPFSFGSDRGDDWVVALPGIVLAGFGVFATFAFVAAVKTRIALDATSFAATVVDGHNRFLMPRFRHVQLSLSDIRAVERRSEIFRSLGFYTMRDALSLVTAENERIGLCSNTMGSAATFPIDEIAEAVARAAGITVTDDGTVRTKGSGLYGAASSSWSEAPLDDVRAGKMRRTAILTAQLCALALLLTLALRACL